MAAPNLTDEFMGEYVREHRCYAALQSVSIADWDRGVRCIEAETKARILAALPETLHDWFCGKGQHHTDSGRPAAGWACERGAAALAAAIETQLSREPGEEG